METSLSAAEVFNFLARCSEGKIISLGGVTSGDEG